MGYLSPKAGDHLQSFISCGKRTLLCDITSGYFNETVWNLLLLIMSTGKQWNLSSLRSVGFFLLTSVEPELHAGFNTNPLDIYLWIKVHWLGCRSWHEKMLSKPLFLRVYFLPTRNNWWTSAFSRRVVPHTPVIWYP